MKHIPKLQKFAWWLQQVLILSCISLYSQWDHHTLKNISTYQFPDFILSRLMEFLEVPSLTIFIRGARHMQDIGLASVLFHGLYQKLGWPALGTRWPGTPGPLLKFPLTVIMKSHPVG